MVSEWDETGISKYINAHVSILAAKNKSKPGREELPRWKLASFYPFMAENLQKHLVN